MPFPVWHLLAEPTCVSPFSAACRAAAAEAGTLKGACPAPSHPLLHAGLWARAPCHWQTVLVSHPKSVSGDPGSCRALVNELSVSQLLPQLSNALACGQRFAAYLQGDVCAEIQS